MYSWFSSYVQINCCEFFAFILNQLCFDHVFTVVAKSNSLRRIRRSLICKISTLSVSDFMKPVKSNPSQAAEQWYDMAIVTHNQIFMKCYIFKSHHLMLEESGFTCKRWFPLSHQVTAQQHTAMGSTRKDLTRHSNLGSDCPMIYGFQRESIWSPRVDDRELRKLLESWENRLKNWVEG